MSKVLDHRGSIQEVRKKLQDPEVNLRLLENSVDLSDRLDALKIGDRMDNPRKKFNMLVSPTPFLISPGEMDGLRYRGRLYRSILLKTAKIYEDALETCALEDPGWIVNVCESGLTPSALQLQRKTHSLGLATPPAIVRADMPDLENSVELNMPGHGWGLMHSVYTEGTGVESPLSEFVAQVIKSRTARENPSIAYLLPEEVWDYEEYFSKKLKDKGVGVKMVLDSDIVDPKGKDLLLHRPSLNDLGDNEGFKPLLDAYFRKDILIEPALTSLWDKKTYLIFPFHPETRHLFTDEERSVFPKTIRITNDLNIKFESEEQIKEVAFKDLYKLPASQRRFILKSAEESGGGRDVYRLDCERKTVRKLVEMALYKVHHGETWVIQEDIKTKFPTPYLGEDGLLHVENMHARITPLYTLTQDQTDMVICCANFKRHWKTHGSKETVSRLVEIA